MNTPILDSYGQGLMIYFSIIRELLIGAAAGWLIRLGMVAFDVLAEVIGTQTSLSFAATTFQDPSLASGLPGQLLTMLAIAVGFSANLHLWFIELIVSSFQSIGVGAWPDAWHWSNVWHLASDSFALGLLFSLPVLIVYLIVHIAQAVVVRVSPQINLFAVGFAIYIPLAFFIMLGLMPQIPSAFERAIESSLLMLRAGLLGASPQ